MAAFHTHLSFAALGSGLLSATLLSVHQAGPTEAFGYFVFGTVGGLLPDIDADSSIPVRLAFGLGSLIGAFLCATHLPVHYALSERLIVGIAAYLFIRYTVFAFFNAVTKHRGIIHSIPAAAFFAFVTAGISYRLFHTTALIAWWQGSFIGLGFLLHLLLDELYSVDLNGAQLKASFGTALKLHQHDDWVTTALMYLAVGVSYTFTPAPQAWLAVVNDAHTYHLMAAQFWPQQGWFGSAWNGGF